MIFLSHNYKDKPLIREIAQNLEKVFGREKVFYDEWSIQPGDSIIDKMNTGIENCKYFLFFVSKNSLASKMVTLEWQSALMKRSKDIKFIPIKLDESVFPAIIGHILYINLYEQGLKVATRQIVDVITGKNTFKEITGFSNLNAEAKSEGNDLVVEIKANYYMEPNSRYLLVVDNNESDLTWKLPDFTEYTSGFNNNISFTTGVHNCILVEVDKVTSPNFPVIVILKPLTDKPIRLLYVMHATSRKDFAAIPLMFKGMAE